MAHGSDLPDPHRLSNLVIFWRPMQMKKKKKLRKICNCLFMVFDLKELA